MKNQKEKNLFFDLLEKSIVEVISNDGNLKYYPPFALKIFKNKYSNLDGGSLTLFKDEIPLKTRKNKIIYKCTCGRIHKIHLSKFLVKKSLRCYVCSETEEKRKKHSETLRDKNRIKKTKLPKPVYDFNSHLEKSIINFNNESTAFIKQYYKKNLTENEFNKIKDKIISIDGVNVKDNEIIFLPPLMVSNQAKYSQYVSVGNKRLLLTNIEFICENCNDVFNTTRRLKTKIQNHKILCRKCLFSNKVFKIKKYETIFNDVITYQSNLELQFIKTCEELNIKILNGPKIPYRVVEKNYDIKYYVDFFLPDFKMIIELKANHVWHRNQLKSGLWNAKQKAAEEYSKNNGLLYKILFQEDIDKFFNLLRYSLDCNENYRS